MFALVALLPRVIAPVPAFTVMPPPPVRERTPALLSVTFPPSETAPPPPRPLPAVTVMAELASCVLATAPAAMFPLCTAPAAICVLPTAPFAILVEVTAPLAMAAAETEPSGR